MGRRLITPSKVTAWLECPHYLTLESRAAAKLLTVERSHLGDFARLVMAKGLQHEEECLDRYRQEGRNILIVEKRGERTFQQWVDDVGNPFTGKHDDVVYQMPFIHKGIQGIADFVVKVISAVGNYGEIYSRNLGEGSSLDLPRGANRLARDGGLMIAPPFR